MVGPIFVSAVVSPDAGKIPILLCALSPEDGP